jgi:hypothetical protein
VEGFCEHGDMPSGSMKYLEILEYLERLVASQEELGSMELGAIIIAYIYMNKPSNLAV